MKYIDGFVAAVPNENKDVYLKHASDSVPLFKDIGVKRQVEAWGVEVPKAEVTDFYRAVNAQPGEAIVFAWMEYDSREDRQAAGKKMQDDDRFAASTETMPFDASRMIYGGFEVVNFAGSGGKPGYVDGYLIPVPTANRNAFIQTAQEITSLLLEQGALRVVDAWGDDLPDGKVTDFNRSVARKSDETVAFSWVEWTSKADRDAAWEKINADPRMNAIGQPFDGERMVMGEFVPVVDG